MSEETRPTIMLDFATSLFVGEFFTATAVVTVPALEPRHSNSYCRYVESMFVKGEPLEEVEPKMIEIARKATIEQLLKTYPESEVMAAMADATITVKYNHLVPVPDTETL